MSKNPKDDHLNGEAEGNQVSKKAKRKALDASIYDLRSQIYDLEYERLDYLSKQWSAAQDLLRKHGWIEKTDGSGGPEYRAEFTHPSHRVRIEIRTIEVYTKDAFGDLE